MLNVKALLSKILTFISNQFNGATGTIIDIGTSSTSVKPTKSGWLVVECISNSQATASAEGVLRITTGSYVVAENTSIGQQQARFFTSCYVKAGVTYGIEIYRATLRNVHLHL